MKDNNTKFGLGDSIKNDIPAGIVVFLVALPLCLGISLASGAEPIAGVIAGIVGGIIVGFASKSALGVSGPAAGIATLISGILAQEHIDFRTFLVISFFAGLFQIIFGYIKAGVIADYFPANVIKGMLAAIGILIILKQIPHSLGDDRDVEGEMGFKQVDGNNTFTEILDALSDPHWGAIIITAISMLILILWQTNYFKKNPILSLIPAPLLVVTTGISINIMFSTNFPSLELSNGHLVNIPDFGSFAGFFTNLQTPNFDFLTTVAPHYPTLFQQYKDLIVTSFTLAIVLSLQTLLSSEAADKLDPYKRVTPANKELIAQGLGNSISALIGGLPLTQVIVRSSANVNAGGKTKISTIVHGSLLFLAVILIPNLLNMIPLACLAAILFTIGYKLASINLFKQMIKLGSRQFLPFIVTICAILFTDLLVGTLIGLIVSIFFILQNNRNNEPFEVKIKKIDKNGKKYLAEFYMNEEVTYLSKHVLMLSFHDIPPNSIIKVDLTGCIFISHDVLESIEDFKTSVAPRKNIEFDVTKRQLGTGTIDNNIIEGLGKVSNLA